MTTETSSAPLTAGAKCNADLVSLIKSRHSLIWIVSREEARVEAALLDVAKAANYDLAYWDNPGAMVDAKGQPKGGRELIDPQELLRQIDRDPARRIYVLRDFHAWLDPVTRRQLRSLSRKLQAVPLAEARAIVILSPVNEVPPELAGHVVVVDYPLPDRAEIAKQLDLVLANLPKGLTPEDVAPNGTKAAAVDAAVGLAMQEAMNSFSRSLVVTQRIAPEVIATDKKRIIAREKVLTWIDPDPRGLDAIGGLDLFKADLLRLKVALSPKARAYGLDPLRGVLLVGVPGSGKSLAAKCIPTAFGIPLLRLDMGALRSKYVGDSEANIRKALAVADTIAPCCVWIDEIEKALAGASGPAGDGGVASDALGVLLNWMQERQGSVFCVATANDVSNLPPELLRKGRFDDVYWVDLPTMAERVQILGATLRPHRAHVAEGVDLAAVATECNEFTGAEVASVVPVALREGFADGERAITTADLVSAAKLVVPLARTAADKIQRLRTWAKGKARPASSPDATETTNDGVRAVEM